MFSVLRGMDRYAGRACYPAVDALMDRKLTTFLDIDIDHLAGDRTLVAAHVLAGGAVKVGQRRAAVADQDRMHCGGVQAQPEGDPGGAQPLGHAQLDDPPLRAHRAAGWAGARPRRPVRHPHHALIAVTARPPGRCGVGDLKSLCCPPDGPPVLHDTPGQAQPSGLAQRGITVGHEGLLLGAAVSSLHTEAGRPSPLQEHPARVAHISITNVRGQYL